MYMRLYIHGGTLERHNFNYFGKSLSLAIQWRLFELDRSMWRLFLYSHRLIFISLMRSIWGQMLSITENRIWLWLISISIVSVFSGLGSLDNVSAWISFGPDLCIIRQLYLSIFIIIRCVRGVATSIGLWSITSKGPWSDIMVTYGPYR